VRDELRLVLAGDVMTGRGVDQVLASPLDPVLHEQYVDDARAYVRLAEMASGPIPHPVGPTWPWGVALQHMDRLGPSIRVMNLETSVTRSDDAALDKAVTYRMSPRNLAVLRAARVDVWALANNHVLDYGRAGLLETLDVMDVAGLRSCGAGRTDADAWRPAVASAGRGQRVLVASVADVSSGVPQHWRATADRPGLALLDGLADADADAVADRLAQAAQPGDVAVVSIHWGSNWGYAVTREQRRFAHRLVDGGVDVVHGHSSHHPRPLEVYRGRLVLYGCGDLVNDYEGIRGYEEFRDDLRLLYAVDLEGGAGREPGRLVRLAMVPLHARRLRLESASIDDSVWLADTLDRECRRLGTRVETAGDGRLCLEW
jgi:poly-gamma-glutamate synthesis protein (capsule biosynthesis protein)